MKTIQELLAVPHSEEAPFNFELLNDLDNYIACHDNEVADRLLALRRIDKILKFTRPEEEYNASTLIQFIREREQMMGEVG